MNIPILSQDPKNLDFPPIEQANKEGLLAIGGDLSSARLRGAYRRGIFPWYSEGQPIMWWSPDPRTVLFPKALKVSRSLRKTLRQGRFQVSLDRNFDRVIRACALPRDGAGVTGTWITPEMIDAYCELHHGGIAHSVEAWLGDELVGGLYGVALGKVFFGESMFSHVSDASKVAFVYLAKQLQAWGYLMIDCQLPSKHLFSLGAQLIRREVFLAEIKRLRESAKPLATWAIDPALRVA